MGNFFVMSTRFNKSSAADFGLVYKNAITATDPKDGSTWIKASLYDFGWGKENGFYKLPLPEFNLLLELALHSTNIEDTYGAAAVILEKYPDELLLQCEQIITDRSRKKDFRKMVELFMLKEPINRSAVLLKTNCQIQEDHTRWVKISEAALRL